MYKGKRCEKKRDYRAEKRKMHVGCSVILIGEDGNNFGRYIKNISERRSGTHKLVCHEH